MEIIIKIKDLISRCLIPKLAKNYEESEKHPEIDLRNKTIHENINLLEQALVDLDLNNNEAVGVIASLLILYLELDSDSTWNNIECKHASKKLNTSFIRLFSVPMKSILYKNDKWNVQDIFDICTEDLHRKLTYENFKKYPGQVAVYYTIIKDLKIMPFNLSGLKRQYYLSNEYLLQSHTYPVTMKPLQIMPVSLLLIDDYINYNKEKGLGGCLCILQCLQPDHFKDGNYYEVIYRTLTKLLHEKDIEITKLTFSCLLKLCEIVPYNEKDKILNELYSNSIEQLCIESNLYRKAECLCFTKNLITIHKTKCINRSDIKIAICDCLDICTENTVAEILLKRTLQCFEEWIKWCWCIWRFPTDHKMISMMIKILYVCKDDELLKTMQKSLQTLYMLCKRNEQKQILYAIEINCNTLPEDLSEKLREIKNAIET